MPILTLFPRDMISNTGTFMVEEQEDTPASILGFYNVKDIHCMAESLMVPPGRYQPQVRLRIHPDAFNLSGTIFRISCIKSSLDLLIFATDSSNDSVSRPCLSKLILTEADIELYKGDWYSVSLPNFVLKQEQKLFFEILSENSEDIKSGLDIGYLSLFPVDSKNSLPILPKMELPLDDDEEGSVFTCSYRGCNKTFTRIFNYRSHRKVHDLEKGKSHICDICGTGFARSQDLARHQVIHTGAKNFKCPGPGCNKRFSRKDALRRHVRSTNCCDLDQI